MTQDELDRRIRGPLLRDRQSATEVLKLHGWLLIPDVRVERLSIDAQGVFHSVKIDDNVEADFAISEVLPYRLHWQFVFVASPSASILEGSQPSVEYDHAIQQTEKWRDAISRTGFSLSLLPNQPDITKTFFSYRILIGQSHQQTVEERSVIREHRRDDLRIRSYDWLLQKPAHYSELEIDALNENGAARYAKANV